MQFATCLLCAGIIAACGVPRAAAQFVPVSQSRTVSASVSGDDAEYDDGLQLISDTPYNGNQSDSAPGFDRFASSASERSPYVGGSASQVSTIGQALVTASGGASGGSSQSPSGYLHHRWSIGAGGSSTFSLTFDVPAPTPVILSGMLHADGSTPVTGFAFVTLIQGGSNLADFHVSLGQPLDLPIDYSSTLAAGRYTLNATASDGATYAGDFSQSSFQFTLQAVPEPGSLAILATAPLLLRPRRGPA